MKKTIILAAAAALFLASCAKIEKNPATGAATADNLAMDFGVYVPKVTKAGSAGEMNNAKLQSTGFGVIAYAKEGTYDGSTKPTFMYNQLVEYSAPNWTYSPIKYWPNQLTDDGVTDGQSAVSKKAYTVSFFAYAPYVASASGSEGIIAMSAASATGDPTITYKVSDDLDKNVDLVWGTSDGNTWTNVAGGDNTAALGLPYLNLQKPAIGTKVNFKFYHALHQRSGPYRSRHARRGRPELEQYCRQNPQLGLLRCHSHRPHPDGKRRQTARQREGCRCW